MRAFGVCWNKWFPSSPPERRVVFEGSSPFSSRITVTEEMTGPGNTMQRMLRFADGDVQSMITLPFDPLSLALPYMQGLAAAFELVPRRRSLLVVGLGGGSFPSFVRARYPDCDVECVELDPVVLRVATEHFYFREDVHCHVRIADGVTFVANAPRASLDCIVLDAYGPTGMPSNVTTPSFLAQCSRVLRDDGVMLANLFAVSFALRNCFVFVTFRSCTSMQITDALYAP